MAKKKNDEVKEDVKEVKEEKVDEIRNEKAKARKEKKVKPAKRKKNPKKVAFDIMKRVIAAILVLTMVLSVAYVFIYLIINSNS